MKLPQGILESDELNTFLENSIDYHLKVFYDKISEYEPISLFNNWKELIRCVDEIINIPIEVKNCDELKIFLQSHINFDDLDNSLISINRVKTFLSSRFDNEVANRYIQLIMMTSAIHKAFINHNYYENSGSSLNLQNVSCSIDFLQSRRIYLVSTLFLIPKIAKGIKESSFKDLLNDFLQIIDSCLVNITTSYHNLIINNSLSDFEMEFDVKKGEGNFKFNQLELFFLNPQRLSLIDQLELRKENITIDGLLGKNPKKIFSFNEIVDTMALLSSAFKKYDVENNKNLEYLNILFQNVARFIIDDYHIVIEQDDFNPIQEQVKDLKLYDESSDYFEILNSVSPFQKSNNKYYTTVVLLNRYAYNLILNDLLSNKKFQINSGFIFENRISEILENNGFIDTKITRINRKEFDVVTIKNNKIYNFQCKNNYYNICDVNKNYKIIANLNRRLCKYYEKAILKEKKRENLLIDKLNITDIEHFVISRFPVITRDKNIINYNNLENWLKNYVS
ncbi:hypothetical protein [Flavobacterium sp. I3-2]|uniref:hypothetical protein n=1 Tax=Flavobacterium sp. I3-2 TaxID=2748319 RepID=UPI0015B0D258|nr:hypothetical protein [Flavobacterium sp. I3-2]